MEYEGPERRVMGQRRIEDRCGLHDVCVTEFTNSINNLTRKITELCKWRHNHESEKEGKMDQIRARFRETEESVHGIKEWLHTRVILLLAGMVANMVLVVLSYVLTTK